MHMLQVAWNLAVVARGVVQKIQHLVVVLDQTQRIQCGRGTS